MTNSNTLSLVELKLAVINYHEEANDFLKVGIARDACYTSYNSIGWKKNQMSDTAGEIKVLMPQRGQEIADTSLERLLSRYEQMEDELETLIERHNADKEVYKQITGQEWLNKPKRTHVSNGLGLDARLKKFA